MKKIVFVLVLLISKLSFAESFFYDYVKFVPDGDTLVLSSRKVVRYIGVDTPEINHAKKTPQMFAEKARKFNLNLVKGKKLKFVYGKNSKDRYGRYLCYVYTPDHKFINKEIIKNGMGFCYYHKNNRKFFKEMLEEQKRAIKNKKGIWQKLSRNKSRVVLNKRRKRFHSLSCNYSSKYGGKNTSSIINAFKRGYSPSRECIIDIFKYKN